MPHNESTIQLLLTRHEIDYRHASGLRPTGGRVVVEMLPASEKIGRILVPEVVAGKYRPDVGVVLAVGPGVSLAPGSTVCVRGYDGQWIDGFDAGYTAANQVRIYGAAARFQGELQAVLWSDSIPLQIVDGVDMVATGHNLLIRREPLVEAEGVLWLRREDQYRNGKASVISIGPECVLEVEGGRVQVGDRIVYNTAGELDFSFGGDPDLAIVCDTAVSCVFG